MSNNALIANLIKMTLKAQKEVIFSPVSYTHLTLPTILLV